MSVLGKGTSDAVPTVPEHLAESVPASIQSGTARDPDGAALPAARQRCHQGQRAGFCHAVPAAAQQHVKLSTSIWRQSSFYIPKLLTAWCSAYASCDTLLREQGTCSRSVPNAGPSSWTRAGRSFVVWRLNRQRCRVPLGHRHVLVKGQRKGSSPPTSAPMHFHWNRRGGHIMGLRFPDFPKPNQRIAREGFGRAVAPSDASGGASFAILR